MPPRNTITPRTRLTAIAGWMLLLLLVARFWYVRDGSAGSGRADAGEIASRPDSTAPALSRKTRPPAEETAAARKERRDEESAAAAQAARQKKLESYLGPGYQLTPRFLADSGLTPEEFASAQYVLDQEWADMARLAASRMIYDDRLDERTPAGQAGHRYRIAALDPDRLKEMAGRLGDLLDTATGGHAAARTDITDAIADNHSFGFHGAAACDIRFVPSSAFPHNGGDSPAAGAGKDTYQIICFMTDEVSGTILYRKQCGFSEFNGDFGNIFQLPE
jgi:hypothetical protein